MFLLPLPPTQMVHPHPHFPSHTEPAFSPIPFRVPSVIPISSHYKSHTNVSSHMLLFFMYVMKQITRELT